MSLKSRWRRAIRRSVEIPTDSRFIREAKIKKHRLNATGDPVLIFSFTIGDGDEDDEVIKYAIHQGLAWQMVRDIRKAVGFSPSELEAAEHWGRYGGGGI